MPLMKSQILIAAPSSGTGKTTITLGLLRALRNRGLQVQSFKCGPDYIDTKYHEMASGKETINLDLFLATENHVKSVYSKYASASDVAVTEGVMGLFDGYDKMEGSSAQIAEKLKIPIILVINAKAMAYSAAPILYGFKNFRKSIDLVGVIFNRVGSAAHYEYLCNACRDVDVVPLGYLPQNEELHVPSRHLGLNIDERFLFDTFADKVAAHIEEYIDIDRLLAITERELDVMDQNEFHAGQRSFKSAVAFDEAFNFVYHENIEYLRKHGEVVFFSPLHDQKVPEADLVYFPGGYPELHAETLARNTDMKESIRHYVESGGKVWAECGGMMYLSTSIVDANGVEFSMVDIFKQKTSMEKMRLTLGYRQFEYNGLSFRGHEFHYSHADGSLESVTTEYDAKNKKTNTKLLRYKNAIGGYTHIYWAEMPDIMKMFK